jgi:hypothetical protein
MSVDRYTKFVMTVIAACLVWISLGGPSLIAPVSAQADGERVVISGWVDENGFVVKFPEVPTMFDPKASAFGSRTKQRPSYPLPTVE